MTQKSVCQIGSKLDALRPSVEWLETIILHVDVYLSSDATRDGARYLKAARKNAHLAQKAIRQGDADGAAFFALGALQAAWQAEMTEGRVMIDGGVKRYRQTERTNSESAEVAERQRASWRAQADRLRTSHPGWNKSKIAKAIDSHRWNTIRRHI